MAKKFVVDEQEPMVAQTPSTDLGSIIANDENVPLANQETVVQEQVEQTPPIASMENSIANEATVPLVNQQTMQEPVHQAPPTPPVFTPSAEESVPQGVRYEDPNEITVTITDQRTPIVIFYGPKDCGKTMSLVRLARYLHIRGYQLTPDRMFRSSNDIVYQEICDNFNQMINSDIAANATNRVRFLLMKVSDSNGRPICQLLEAPGEHYFPPKNPSAPYPAYINRIVNNKIRKIWLFYVEPDWLDHSDRLAYASRISNFKRQRMRTQDKSIFVFNKIDKTNLFLANGQVNTPTAFQVVKNAYPGIFRPFENQIPIVRFFEKYNAQFVPFSTGDFNQRVGGGQTFTEGPDEYPRNLWNAIVKYIKG